MRRLLSPLLVLALLLDASDAAADHKKRSRACDDGVARPRGVACPTESECAASQIKALLHGCFYCVDSETCLVAFADAGGAQGELQDAPEDAVPIPSATNPQRASGTGVVMIKSSAGGANSALAVASKDDAAAVAPTMSVSNLVFAAPVALAAVAAFVALRMRRSKPRERHKFQRLQEEAATEEINPFCIAVMQQDSDDGELELSDEECKEGDDDDEDCDAEGPSMVVARSILDGIEEEEDEGL